MEEETGLHRHCMDLLLQGILKDDLRFAAFACLPCVLFAHRHLEDKSGLIESMVDMTENAPGCPTCGTPGFILPKHPYLVIQIRLDWGVDEILRTACEALEAVGVEEGEVAAFVEEAEGLGYKCLLALVSKWMWFLLPDNTV